MTESDPLIDAMADSLATKLPAESDADRARNVRRCRTAVIKAGCAAEAAKARQAVAAWAGAMPLGHQIVLKKICAAEGSLLVPVNSPEINTICALLIVRKLVKAKLSTDGLWIEYRATACGRAMLQQQQQGGGR